MAGVHNLEFTARCILEHFFPRKWKFRSVYERVRSIRYQKRKLNVIMDQLLYLQTYLHLGFILRGNFGVVTCFDPFNDCQLILI